MRFTAKIRREDGGEEDSDIVAEDMARAKEIADEMAAAVSGTVISVDGFPEAPEGEAPDDEGTVEGVPV